MPATAAAGRVIDSGWRASPSTVRWRRREAHAEQGGSEHTCGDEGQGEHHTVAVGTERGDEHEEHGAGDERLTPCPGVEGEGVGGQHDERRADGGEQRPTADVLDRRHGRRELVAHQAEIGPGDVPRLAGGEDRGERRRVGHPGDRPGEPGGREHDGDKPWERVVAAAAATGRVRRAR